METIAGSVALVSGAGGGIGRAVARALVAAGAEAWLVGRTEQTLDETARLCGPGSTRTRRVDVTDKGEVVALLGELEREVGRLDVFVQAAGTMERGTFAEAPPESFDHLYTTNVRAFYVFVQAALPLLRHAEGQIVVVNSSVVSGPRPGVGQYAATQHALRALTDTLRQEVNADGVRVLSVFPGRTATPLQERAYAEDDRAYTPELLLQPEDLATMIVSALGLPRSAEVTDIHIRPMLKSY